MDFLFLYKFSLFFNDFVEGKLWKTLEKNLHFHEQTFPSMCKLKKEMFIILFIINIPLQIYFCLLVKHLVK